MTLRGLDEGTTRHRAQAPGETGKDIEEAIDLGGRVSSAERKAQSAAGANRIEPESEEHVRRLGGVGRAAGAAGRHGEPFLVERQEKADRLPLLPFEKKTEMSREASGGMPEKPGRRDLRCNAIDEALSKGDEPNIVVRHRFRGEARRFAEPDEAGNVLGAGTQAPFLPSATNDGREPDAVSNDERPDPLRTVDLVRGKGEEVDRKSSKVERDLSRRLHRVGVERHPPVSRQTSAISASG